MNVEIKTSKKKKTYNKRNNGVIVRYLTERAYKRIVKRQAVRIMVNGETVELRSRNQKELKQIAAYKAKIKELQKKIK